MVVVRGHFTIDLVGGLIFSHYLFIQAERISYFFDSKLLGLPAIKRFRNFFKPCKKCGFSNWHAADYMTKDEKIMLLEMH